MLAQNYNFDDYSSKGSTVHPVKKFHRNLEGLNQYAQEGALQEQGPAGLFTKSVTLPKHWDVLSVASVERRYLCSETGILFEKFISLIFISLIIWLVYGLCL